MNKKSIAIVLGIAVLTIATALYYSYYRPSQTPHTAMKRPVVIGIVEFIPVLKPIIAGFKQGMTNLGYVEGKDVVYIDESSNGNPDLTKLNAIVKDELAKGAQILYTLPIESSMAALQETRAEGKTNIPIVAANANAPLQWGLIKSYQSSGNNVTGIAIDLSADVGKELEFLRRLAPSAKTIGIFTEKHPGLTGTLTYQELVKDAPQFGFTLVTHTIQSQPGPNLVADLTKELSAYKAGDFDAWYEIPTGPYDNPQASAPFIAMANRMKIPSIVLNGATKVVQGGLFSYVYDYSQTGIQSASFVDKIIKGAAPSDIPFEFPTKDNIYVNTTTAAKIGITIPNSILSIATQIFK